MKQIPQVDQYLVKKSEWSALLSILRDIILSTGLEETIKWGAPVYTLEGKNILGLGAFKKFGGIWFFQGALLKDPQKVLINAQEGKTKALRQWRFTSEIEVPADLVKSYIEEAIENHKQGREIKPSAPAKKPLVIPPELQKSLDLDAMFGNKFESLSLTNKREFAEYIDSAKRNETRINRLEKVVLLVSEGKGLYDKYK